VTARGASFASNVVDQMKTLAPSGLLPIANLGIDCEMYSLDTAAPEARAFRISAGSALELILAFSKTSGQPLPDALLSIVNEPKPGLRPLDAYRARGIGCDPTGLDSRGHLTQLRTSQVRARGMVASNLGDHFMLGADNPEMNALDQRYGSRVGGSPGASAALAYQAIRWNVSNCVTMRLTQGLDTHDATWPTNQPRLQYEAWRALGTLVDDLKTLDPVTGKRLIDTTTMVVFSEFSRTPALNAFGGRDHSLTNACLIIGAGVPHNRVIGASSAIGMAPQRIDPMSGAVSSTGVDLRPQDVWASVLQANGYDSSLVQTTGLPCLMT
jgi:hypothetical protein